jgi:hypothetical protein
MDYQVLFGLILAAFGVVVGWLWLLHRGEIKDLKDVYSRLEKDQQALLIKVLEGYVNKVDFKEFSNLILTKLEQIYQKLENKADKT